MSPKVWSLAAATTLALTLPSAAAAHFNSGLYSHRANNCSSRSDPITVVFYAYATGSRTLNHIKAHTGWGGGSGGGQYFASHGICGAGTQHAESGLFTRYHIRMRKTYDGDTTWRGTTTVGTPHHEDWIDTINELDCWPGNHAVDKGGVSQPYPYNQGNSGFDQGRKRIFNALYGQSGHTYALSENWGNTQEFKQCDGDWAGSNGTVFWFRIPNSSH